MHKVKFIISIDTECDKDLNWNVQQPLSFHNIKETCDFNDLLQSKFSESKITLLLSPEVILDNDSVRLLKKQNQTELGTHMHLEFLREKILDVDVTSEVQAEISSEEDQVKLAQLTQLFIEKFGYQPLCFRAGRYGYNINSTFDALSKLGYKVDSSIAPYSIFKYQKDIAVDNTRYNVYPFGFSHGLIEVPITVVNQGNQILYGLSQRIPSYSIRKYFEFLKPKQYWIRPSYEDVNSLKKNSKILFESWDARKHGTPIVNMMFHSNELFPGASPYNASWTDVEAFKSKIIQYIDWLNNNYKLEFIYLSDVELKA